SLQTSLASLREELEAVKSQKTVVEQTYATERDSLLEEIRNLMAERDHFKNETDTLNAELDDLWDEYQNYKATLSEPQKKLIVVTKQLADSNALLESLLKRTAMVRAY